MKKIIIGVVVVVAIVSAVYLVYAKLSGVGKGSSPAGVDTGKKLFIPRQILENKFGFLSGMPKDSQIIKSYGVAWARPHPGPFLWDSMQESAEDEIDFSGADRLIQKFQKQQIGILATLWNFADWDQKNRPDANSCQVSVQDEFLPRGFKGVGHYLPLYRCNPYDWAAYQKWINAVIERYDGDGNQDMPGLEIPIKYWEVINEPDLKPMEDGRLQFYRQEPKDYAELLIKTSEAIKRADSTAKVLIAGAAGGNDQFLDFYREVFKNKQAKTAFDIANVHCISNDQYDSFNVEPYQKMLAEFGLDKPIWVTEAEAVVSKNRDINAAQTLESSKKALELGAEKIFFTRYDFGFRDGANFGPQKEGLEEAQKVYKKITGLGKE